MQRRRFNQRHVVARTKVRITIIHLVIATSLFIVSSGKSQQYTRGGQKRIHEKWNGTSKVGGHSPTDTNMLLSDTNSNQYPSPRTLIDYDVPANKEKQTQMKKKDSDEVSGKFSRSRMPLQDQSSHHSNSPNLWTTERKLPIQDLTERRPTTNCDGVKKIVQCKAGISEEICKQELVESGVKIMSDMPNTMFFAVCVSTQGEIDLIATLARVQGIEDDPPRTLSYVPGSHALRTLQVNEQIIPYGVDSVKAREFWARYGGRGFGVKVCVIDTGLLATHEDMNAADVSGSTNVQLVNPWNEDGFSHGTHVTGIIAARDNLLGIVGVAPEASIHVARVFNNRGEFLVSDLVNALNACAEAGVDIINMSLGGPIESSAERSIIRTLTNSGILLVAAAGNTAEKRNGIDYPAAYEDVISVGAVDQNLHIADFSSHNSQVDIVAPGVDILSMGSSSNNSYMQISGTSMATPHVSAVAALLWSQFPTASSGDIRAAIEASARDLGACGTDRLFGHGMLDAVAAAAYLTNGNVSSPNSETCVQVQISVATDDWGEETTYLITPQGDARNVLFRGGPYVNNLRATYTDNIQIPAGCYDLILRDTYGDGTNNGVSGRGEITLVYSGMLQVNHDDFQSFQQSFTFGNCDGTLSSPGTTTLSICGDGVVDPGEDCDDGNTDNTDACSSVCATSRCGDGYLWTGIEECDDGNMVDGDGCSSSCMIENIVPLPSCSQGESLLEIRFETDLWAPQENSLYFYDDAAPDNQYIWAVSSFEFEPNNAYQRSACLKPSTCYRFFFYDTGGDGLINGGLTLTRDGNQAFRINPGETGTILEQGSPKTFWSKSFGPCLTA